MMEKTQIHIREINFKNTQYTFYQDSSLGHGGCIWDGALVLIKYFEKNLQNLKDKYDFSNKIILELGSGTGICGIIFSEFKPKSIYISDLEYLFPLMKENIKLNKENIKCDILVEELIWGEKSFEKINEILKKNNNAIDFLIWSDLIDSSGIFLEDLLKTLEYLFEKNPKLVVFNCYTIHKKKTVDHFMFLLKEKKIDSEEVNSNDMDDEYKSDDIGICILSKNHF